MSDPNTELVMTRIFDAPRELVYQAFIDPDQLSQWFGPVGWSVPRDTVDIDARVGGYERFEMVADDGSGRSPVNGTFTELIENELIVTTELWEMRGQPAYELTARLEFHDEGENKTRLIVRQGPYTEEMEDMARQGWDSSFTKLDKLLATVDRG